MIVEWNELSAYDKRMLNRVRDMIGHVPIQQAMRAAVSQWLRWRIGLALHPGVPLGKRKPLLRHDMSCADERLLARVRLQAGTTAGHLTDDLMVRHVLRTWISARRGGW